MNLKVDKKLRTPLYWQISDQIKKLILEGKLPYGAALPSERTMAKLLSVHRNTVVKAYGMLKDWELVISLPGVGYQVDYAKGKEDRKKLIEQDRPVNWSHIIKDEYLDMEKTFDDIFSKFAEKNSISFSTGMPPIIYDEENLATDITAILKNNERRPFFLSPYQGDTDLRLRLIAYLRTKGIKAGLGQIQVMSEANQALDFIITAILHRGDKVIIEEPVSPDVYRTIELAGCIPITLPLDENGMICDDIEALIEIQKPKFIYVNSSYQNPTGSILSIQRRKKLLQLSNLYRLPIIEDDESSELSFDGEFVPSIKSMDRGSNVIYIYSFALTFIPGLSMTFVVGPEELIQSLSYMVSIRTISLEWLPQKILSMYLEDGRYQTKNREMVVKNRGKMEIMTKWLDKLREIGVSYIKPKGGAYIWCKLPQGVHSKAVVSQAEKQGVSVIPGEVFYPYKNGGHNYIRLNFSYEVEERIEEGMKILTDIIKVLAQ